MDRDGIYLLVGARANSVVVLQFIEMSNGQPHHLNPETFEREWAMTIKEVRGDRWDYIRGPLRRCENFELPKKADGASKLARRLEAARRNAGTAINSERHLFWSRKVRLYAGMLISHGV